MSDVPVLPSSRLARDVRPRVPRPGWLSRAGRPTHSPDQAKLHHDPGGVPSTRCRCPPQFLQCWRVLAAAGLAAGVQGCAAAAIAVVGTAIGAGASVAVDVAVEQSLSGIVYKTFVAPADDVHRATLRVLARMAIPVTGDQAVPASGWTLAATAAHRIIRITVEGLTPNTTRIRVVVNDGRIFFNDRATATTIINEVAEDLRQREQPAAM